jgi:predicted DNA-binding transcriptional regulator AlpA
MSLTEPVPPTAPHASDSPAPPLLIPDAEAARLCGIGRATWHRLRAAGRIGPQPVRLGRAVRYRRAEVERWAAAGCPDAATWRAMVEMEGRRPARAVDPGTPTARVANRPRP